MALDRENNKRKETEEANAPEAKKQKTEDLNPSAAILSDAIPHHVEQHLTNGVLVDKSQLCLIIGILQVKALLKPLPKVGNIEFIRNGYVNTNIGEIIKINSQFLAVSPPTKELKSIGKEQLETRYLQDISSNEWYELKTYQVNNNSDLKTRITNEIQCLNKTGQLLESAEANDKIYIIKKYIPGIDLYHFLKNNPKLSYEERKEIAVKIIEALNTLHNLKIIHRDVKLDNIIWHSKTKTVTFIDFDVSLICDNPSTGIKFDPKNIALTKNFIAPEAISEAIANDKTDIYALGMSLFELFDMKLEYDFFSKSFKFFKDVKESDPLVIFLKTTVARKPEDRPSLDNLKSFFNPVVAVDQLKKQ